MSAPKTEDIAEVIERARFGSLQLLIRALCARIALLDGFDTQATAYVASGWNAQSVVLIAAMPALLAGMAIIVLRAREPNVTIVSSAATVHHES